jgi:hypothetical protein
MANSLSAKTKPDSSGLIYRNPSETNLIEMVNNSTTNIAPVVKNNNVGWLPPELTADYSNVFVYIGNQGMSLSLTEAQMLPTDVFGKKYAMNDLPNFLAKGLDTDTNPSPRERIMRFKTFFAGNLNGKEIIEPVQPLVISNRFFVVVEIPFLNVWRKILLDDDYLYDLTKPLPQRWDYNFSTNPDVFEIVNEYTNPVLQVIYKWPNEVRVGGIFIIGKNVACGSFGAPLKVMFVGTNNKIAAYNDNLEITNTRTTYGNSDETMDLLYNAPISNRMTIFKYPSNRHLGVFSDWYSEFMKTNNLLPKQHQ